MESCRVAPFSVIYLNAMVSVWISAVRAEVPKADPLAFADDTGALVDNRRAVQLVADVTQNFAALTGQQLNAKKSMCFTTVEGRRKRVRLGREVVSWVFDAKVVGGAPYVPRAT